MTTRSRGVACPTNRSGCRISIDGPSCRPAQNQAPTSASERRAATRTNFSSGRTVPIICHRFFTRRPQPRFTRAETYWPGARVGRLVRVLGSNAVRGVHDLMRKGVITSERSASFLCARRGRAGQSCAPVSSRGQDTWFSATGPGFESPYRYQTQVPKWKGVPIKAGVVVDCLAR